MKNERNSIQTKDGTRRGEADGEKIELEKLNLLRENLHAEREEERRTENDGKYMMCTYKCVSNVSSERKKAKCVCVFVRRLKLQ